MVWIHSDHCSPLSWATWTGGDYFALDHHLDFWLAGGSASACRVLVLSRAVEAGLVPPLYAWGSMGCYSCGTLGYMTRRPAADRDGQEMTELGACAYGPDAEGLAGEIAGRIMAWSQARPGP